MILGLFAFYKMSDFFADLNNKIAAIIWHHLK